jgi:RluA family pseudouridine synthase
MKKVKLTTTREHATRRLDHTLADWLPKTLGRSVSNAKVRKLIMAGAVRLNGRPMKLASKTLSEGSTIEAYIDVAKLFDDSTSRDKQFELTADRILFEDEDLIVVDKPSGLPAHPTADEARDNLFAAIMRFLSQRDGVAKPYVGVHQRLDRDTSGVVLFTKSQRVNAAVSEIFAKHQGTKVYHALTLPPGQLRSGRKVERQWTIKNYLSKVSSKSKRVKYGAVEADGNFAETSFRILEQYPRGLRIEAIPKTGRTHQIRVHLSEYGLPILGDDLYGPDHDRFRKEATSRLMLHAAKLIFPHPIMQRDISIESPIPDDFRQCLNRIKTHE